MLMVDVPQAVLGGNLRVLLEAGTMTGLSDGELLERFASRRDEAAFAALVERHGPMVHRVCREVLAGHHDAQDAFQATFLVLARQAGSIRRRTSVASWLYGVALRVARCARSASARRRRHERNWAFLKAAEARTGTADRHDPGPLHSTARDRYGVPEPMRLSRRCPECGFAARTVELMGQEWGMVSPQLPELLSPELPGRPLSRPECVGHQPERESPPVLSS